MDAKIRDAPIQRQYLVHDMYAYEIFRMSKNCFVPCEMKRKQSKRIAKNAKHIENMLNNL